MVMKQSSARRARRWIIQELARNLNRPSDTAATAAWSSDGKAMKAETNPASAKAHNTSEDYTASRQYYIDQ
jgi:hypothetical protein